MEENPLIPEGDVLLLAGDIVVGKYRDRAEPFYETVRRDFDFIIETMGNHEFYHGEPARAYPDSFERLAKNHVRLNNRSIEHGGVKFIVSVLWTHVAKHEAPVIESGLNDYHLIRHDHESGASPIDSTTTNRFNEISVAFIESELKKPHPGKIVVMTHHLPSFNCIIEKYEGHPLNAGFANHLDALIESHHIDLWVHGHSHDFFDKVIGGTRIVRNPLFEDSTTGDLKLNREFVI